METWKASNFSVPLPQIGAEFCMQQHGQGQLQIAMRQPCSPWALTKTG